MVIFYLNTEEKSSLCKKEWKGRNPFQQPEQTFYTFLTVEIPDNGKWNF